MVVTSALNYCSCFFHPRFSLPPSSSPLHCRLLRLRPFCHFPNKKFSTLAMEASTAVSSKEMPLGLDATTEEEYASQSKLLQEFANLSTIDKAWVFKSDDGNSSRAMFSISQTNLLANKTRTHILSAHMPRESNNSVSIQWAPFPVEMTGVSTVVPSPSGSKLLVVRNQENESPTQFEIWGPSQLQKEIHIPKSIHGSIYTDKWFEAISWHSNETLIAYVAEEPSPSKPAFDGLGYKRGNAKEKDCGSWKGQGDWEQGWGETYEGKRQPALFVLNIDSGDVCGVEGISKSLSVGQVVWAPTLKNLHQYLVFVGWSTKCGPQEDATKLGIKYCYNRPCALYAVRAPFNEPDYDKLQNSGDATEGVSSVVNLTQGISSAYFPRFSKTTSENYVKLKNEGRMSEKLAEKTGYKYVLGGLINPDGHSLVFLSSKSAVDSGAHCATDSLHRIDWSADDTPCSPAKFFDVVPVVMCAEDGCFPGLYCPSVLCKPWLSDGHTMILPSSWGSQQVILSVDMLSGHVSRISPTGSSFSWSVLALDGDNVLAVSSSPIDPPQLKYGCPIEKEAKAGARWDWLDVSSPMSNYSEKVRSLLSSRQFDILKISVRNGSDNLTEGAKKPYEAIFVSSKSQNTDACDPLIVMLHGGPHSVSLTSYSKSLAFLSSLGYSLLIVNYRGSLGFGEEALQSLPGKAGLQDVNDVLAAIDHVIEKGLADPSKLAVLGGSHGGFLTTHLIGQAPDRFVVAAARNPVCNLSLMAGTTDIPDWCYMESYGSEGKSLFTTAPSPDHLNVFYQKSPISHISKVKTPTIFLLGAKDLRVPVSNGLQYARKLKAQGVDVKLIVFPNDVHGIDRPQSDFESFLNIGVWFKKYLK